MDIGDWAIWPNRVRCFQSRLVGRDLLRADARRAHRRRQQPCHGLRSDTIVNGGSLLLAALEGAFDDVEVIRHDHPPG